METNLKEKAKQQFEKMIKEEVQWIAKNVWPENVKHRLNRISRIIEAAKQLEAIDDEIELLNELEVNKLTEKIVPLRILEMTDEVELILIDALISKNIRSEIFLRNDES